MTETQRQGKGNKKGMVGECGEPGGPLNRPWLKLKFALSR